MQPCLTPRSIENHSDVPQLVLTAASWFLYRCSSSSITCTGKPICFACLATVADGRRNQMPYYHSKLSTCIGDVILFVLLHDYPDVDHLFSGPLSFHKARLFLIDLG